MGVRTERKKVSLLRHPACEPFFVTEPSPSLGYKGAITIAIDDGRFPLIEHDLFAKDDARDGRWEKGQTRKF